MLFYVDFSLTLSFNMLLNIVRKHANFARIFHRVIAIIQISNEKTKEHVCLNQN